MAKYCEGLEDWRDYGTEFVALPQRGIGESGVAMPRGYAFPSMCRTRRHPGINPCVPLEQDLAKASAVVTWGSGAAIKALAMGIPCFHAFPQWIAAGASTPIELFPEINRPCRKDTFKRIFNSMWTMEEVENGVALCEYL
jgi:hypothetical protein